MELQRASISLDVQSVKLSVSGQGSFSTKQMLKNAMPSAYQLFVQRDGFLIRYSTDVEEFVGIEPTIQEIRLLNKVELAKGTFFLLEQKKDKFWLTKVEAWIPRQVKVVETPSSLEKIIKDDIVFTDADTAFLKGLGFKDELLFEFPDIHFSKEYVVKSIAKQAKIAQAILGGTAGLVLLGAIATWWGTDTVDTQNLMSTIRTVETKPEDKFEAFRNYQVRKTTVGRSLYAAEAVYHTFKESSLPKNWESSPINITPNLVNSRLIPTGNRIGRVSDIEYVMSRSPNQRFLTVEGQQVEMNVPLDNDGAGFSNSFVHFDDVRAPILDLLADMKASRIQSMQVHTFGSYKTQRVIVDFSNVSPLHIGVLSRAFANKPIYIEKGTITEQDGLVSINLEFTFISKA